MMFTKQLMTLPINIDERLFNFDCGFWLIQLIISIVGLLQKQACSLKLFTSAFATVHKRQLRCTDLLPIPLKDAYLLVNIISAC